ncbi:MAG: hypothetical protein QM607_00565 [Microbacterium sp.]
MMAVLAIVDARAKLKRGDLARLATGTLVVKLCGIPFFVVNFLLVGLISWALAFFGIVIGAAAIVLIDVAMLTTSVYRFATLALLRRRGALDGGFRMLYRAMLCIFVLDIVAGIALHAHARRERARATDAQEWTP